MSTSAPAQHYRAPGLLTRIEAGLRAVGKAPPDVSVADLAPVDEFHVRGPAATAELIELLDASPEMHVLDAGAGLGGPARHLAHETGCRVTGVDLSEDYVNVGTALNQWTGLDDRVDLVVGDVTDLDSYPPGTFDAAWSLHAEMNIADKPAFYAELARVLKPGARLVLYNLLFTDRTDPYALPFPMPWARQPSDSHLATRAEVQATLVRAGFGGIEVRDRTAEGVAFFEAAFARAAQAGPPPLGLHLLFGPVFSTMIGNLAQVLTEGRLSAVAFTATRGG